MKRPLLSVLVAVLALLVAPASAQAGRHRPPPGPVDLTGVLRGAQFEIRVPARWNGTLVMYAHGYRDAADHPGEPDDRSADAFFGGAAGEEAMLAAGYAIAGSGYAANGWAVDEGLHDTKALVEHFERVVARPRTTLLAGFSMGSVVALESMERYRGTYDGVMPSCSVAAGAPRAFDGTMALLSAYDAVFGMPAAWGRPNDVRDDLDFDTEVLPVLLGQLGAPGGAAKFEFVRLAAGVPMGPEWPGTIWYFITEARAELERRAGGPVAQNRSHRYAVSATDRAYLAGIGVTGQQVDTWLAAMTASRVGPERTRRYVERYAEYDGRISAPTLTMGTTVDALVPPAHVSAFTEDVRNAHRTRNLASVWTSGVGHCAFTPQQLVTAVRALERWVHTGQRPGSMPADQGFVSYTPPPWPYR